MNLRIEIDQYKKSETLYKVENGVGLYPITGDETLVELHSNDDHDSLIVSIAELKKALNLFEEGNDV